jgi:hypothetical protein
MYKNVPLGETTTGKIINFYIPKIKDRGVQNTYTMACHMENCKYRQTNPGKLLFFFLF